MGEAHRTVITCERCSGDVIVQRMLTFVFFARQYRQAADTCARFASGGGAGGEGRARPLFGVGVGGAWLRLPALPMEALGAMRAINQSYTADGSSDEQSVITRSADVA